MKRLIEKLGVEVEESEAHAPVDYFNRVAGIPGGAFFVAPIKHRMVQDNTGTNRPKAEVDIFKVEAAA